jgi:DNA-binding IclR family transcriptional regulator
MLRRILGDYLDMPDLRLSPAQAQRVWQLDEHTCTQLLESLTENGSLDRRQDGTYSLRAFQAISEN